MTNLLRNLLAVALLAPVLVCAQVPLTLSYQGHLTNAAGQPITVPTAMTFRLYNVASGGASLWEETQASVAISNGVFSVTLGAVTSLNLPFDVPYYLGVSVGGDPEMLPRQALAASPYALRAASANTAATATIATTATAVTGTVDGSQIAGTLGGGVTIAGASISGSTLTQLDGRYGAASTVQPPQANSISVVDATGDVGRYSSITVGPDGLPVISYYDVTNGNLKVAKCGNMACSAGNTITSVDTTGDVGQHTSIAIGANGLPLVSYIGVTGTDLKLVFCGDPACSGGNTIRNITNGDGYTSILIGADALPIMLYKAGTDLRVAKCANATCLGGNTLVLIDSVMDVGQYSSFALGTDGLPVISYPPAPSGLKVVKCGNAACSAGNVVTDFSEPAVQTSLTLGADGRPVIAYWGGSMDLKVAKCGNPSCSAGNTLTTIDATGDVGQHASITVGADGFPVISYYDATNFDLKVVKCGNPACSEGNTIIALDTGGDVGQYTSVTIGVDGMPVISYYDVTNQDLKVARCGNAFCAPYVRRR